MKVDLSTAGCFTRFKAHMHRLFVDFGFFRVCYLNLHPLSDKAWRSAQPSPRRLRQLKRRLGIKTVVNLRGAEPGQPFYELEREACTKLGIKMVDVRLYSRMLPDVETMREVRRIIDEIEYPALFHCKSGADRTGLMGAFYMHWKEGVPVDKTGQLSFWPYLHVSHAKTGVLDRMITAYMEDSARSGQSFEQWVLNSYDPDRVAEGFRPALAMDFLVDRLLRRE